MSTESWDTVTGFCFFVRNTRGRTFPMLQTFGLTVSDAKARVREMIARRAEYNRSPLDVVSLAQVTLTTDAQLVHYANRQAWRAQPTDAFSPLPQRGDVLAELEHENNLLRARNERLQRELNAIQSASSVG